jgi:hypothetical protein
VAKAEDKATPESTAMYAVEDVWLNAFAQLPADTKPLADLLCDPAVPMPLGIRVLFADHLNPNNPVGQLVYTPVEGFESAIHKCLPTVYDYGEELNRQKLVREKNPSQRAAAIVGEETGQSDRSVYRRLREWRTFIAKLTTINRR